VIVARGGSQATIQFARRLDTLSSTLNDIERSVGLLDLAEVRRILQKYTGSSSTTNQLGGSHAGDTADAGRAAAVKPARVRGAVESTKAVAAGYKNFWNARNQESRDWNRR
jgi:hypothetical protein